MSEVFLESWRESLDDLPRTDEILFTHISMDLTTEEKVATEKEIIKYHDQFKREFNLMLTKTKTIAATLSETELAQSGTTSRRSFGDN